MQRWRFVLEKIKSDARFTDGTIAARLGDDVDCPEANACVIYHKEHEAKRATGVDLSDSVLIVGQEVQGGGGGGDNAFS